MIDDELIILDESEKMPRLQYINMYNTIGAAIEVFNVLGRGMEEAIYQEALEMELTDRDIPFISQQPLLTWYKGKQLKKTYFADIVTYSNIIVELKTVEKITKDHRSQLFNYMRITKQKCGILMNFSDSSFYCERYWYVESMDEFRLIKKENLQIYVSQE